MKAAAWLVGLVFAFATNAAAQPRAQTAWALGARLEAGEHEALIAEAAPTASGHVAYLLGRALRVASKAKESAMTLARARGVPGLTADVAVRQGDAWLAAGELSHARTAFARALVALDSAQVDASKAALLGLVRALSRAKRCEEAARAVQRAGRTHDLGAPTAVLLSLARCHARAGDLVEAARRFDRIVAFRAKSALAEEAQKGLDALAAHKVMPPPMSFVDGLRAVRSLRWAKKHAAARARLASLAVEGAAQARLSRFERGELQHSEGDHAAAAVTLRALFDESPREAGAEGYLRLAARCLREASRGKEAAEMLLVADRAVRGPTRNGRDLWRAAELLTLEGEGVRAAKLWLALALREKRHRDAPRAFVRAVEAFIEAGAHRAARKVVARFPAPWARRRIAWRVRFLGAWAAYRMGDLRDAARRLARIEAAPRAPALDRLRARYWRARIQEKSTPKAARDAHAALLREAPTHYYADLATSRLRVLDAPNVPPLPAPPPLEVPPPSKPVEPSFARPDSLPPTLIARLDALVKNHGRALPQLSVARALASAGLVRETANTLESAQHDVDAARRRPSRRPAFGAAKARAVLTPRQRRRRVLLRRIDRAAFALALVPVYALLGDRARAQRYRARFGRTREGLAARKQQRAFPMPFRDLVGAAAKSHALPEPLLFAIMRQESAFRPDALSVVGARGLMQIMPRTGRLISERLQDKLARGALDEPALSLRYGAWYFWQLLLKYRGQVPLAIAAYNGGPKAVSRWLDQRKASGGASAIAADEFLEEIPFTETRRYVRKVLRSMRTYRARLSGGPGAYVPALLDPAYGDNINF